MSSKMEMSCTLDSMFEKTLPKFSSVIFKPIGRVIECSLFKVVFWTITLSS